MKPRGFYAVVGFTPYTYNGVYIATATFAVRKSAVMFAAKHGGKVKKIKADG